MVAFAQPFSRTAGRHLSFDAAILSAACLAFPDDRVLLLTDPVSAARLQAYLRPAPANLTITVAGVEDGGTRRLRLRLRLWRSFIAVRQAARAAGVRHLVYLAFDTVTAAVAAGIGRPPSESFFVHNNFNRARRGGVEGRLFKRVAGQADQLLFLEPAIAAKAVEEHFCQPEKTRTIPFPINTELWAPAGLQGNEQLRSVVLAGAVNSAKGYDQLALAADEALRDPRVAARLRVAAVGPMGREFRRSGRGAALDVRTCTLTDEELNDTIRAATFAVAPFSYAAYEYVTPGSVYRAWSCGRPVILTKVPALDAAEAAGLTEGLTCTDVPSLVQALCTAATMDVGCYQRLVSRIREFGVARDRRATAGRLREILPA